jgi:hypothetical protein
MMAMPIGSAPAPEELTTFSFRRPIHRTARRPSGGTPVRHRCRPRSGNARVAGLAPTTPAVIRITSRSGGPFAVPESVPDVAVK